MSRPGLLLLVFLIVNLGCGLEARFEQEKEMKLKSQVVRVQVDRTLGWEESIGLSGHVVGEHFDRDAADTMPGGIGSSFNKTEEVEVWFFTPRRRMTDMDVQEEFARRGLTPVDPYVLSAAMAIPSNSPSPRWLLGDWDVIGTHWCLGGRWCRAIFSIERTLLVRYVVGTVHWEEAEIYCTSDESWSEYSWFAGVRPSVQEGKGPSTAKP